MLGNIHFLTSMIFAKQSLQHLELQLLVKHIFGWHCVTNAPSSLFNKANFFWMYPLFCVRPSGPLLFLHAIEWLNVGVETSLWKQLKLNIFAFMLAAHCAAFMFECHWMWRVEEDLEKPLNSMFASDVNSFWIRYFACITYRFYFQII